VRARRQRATHETGDDGDLRADPGRSTIGQQGAGRHAHEGVQHVVDAVDVGDLVGKEVEREQDRRHAQHPGRGQHLQIVRQADQAQPLGAAQHQHGGIGIEPARPAGTQCHGKSGKGLGTHRRIKKRAAP